MNLYRATFKVRPSPAHPKYYEVQFGYLNLFLFAANADAAGDRAEALFALLPYEKVGDKIAIFNDTNATAEQWQGMPWMVNAILTARHTGFSVTFEAWAVGHDEAEFIKSPMPGERKNPGA